MSYNYESIKIVIKATMISSCFRHALGQDLREGLMIDHMQTE
jgi:hypothetical protein